MRTYQLRCRKNEENPQVWEVISSNDSDSFPPGLVLLSLESSKRILFFEEGIILGPPWVNSIMEKWLREIAPSSEIDQTLLIKQVKIKIYFYREDLDIIEEVPGTATPEFESQTILLLNLNLERRNSITKPQFYRSTEYDQASKLDKLEDKIHNLEETARNCGEKLMDIQARLLSIEKDDYVKQEEYYLWKLITRDNFRGMILIFVIFTILQILYTDLVPVNKIIRPMIGLPTDSYENSIEGLPKKRP